ncbi:putative Glycosyltransferase [Vibrio crassostreae]|uniref:glycosyltransferase n=1 Tax=Vibrio crassostreae TaxID=246167 RepID=UPI0005E6CB93|nr:glycosyltransferase [Vibrio crassostreae]TCT62618.1 glycosyltransferase involved in cell wall biosynthesis [Vibrio crassostreae]TCT83378.1 glycosyltransferase involved in cell wall biosynthesis [Vibrio crassostreae]TCU03789.1 glycosyltransferase involved in cell wall biosynthesis [Vibrio crassostreae]TDW09528.1 glycosyltransferase involved in cell wall biosynthesis [Vibrio crassostreae]CAK2050689.1 putative Glycosyltransferase [Vibrio crassostreae]
MLILFNAGNLWVGGGIQKSVWFVTKSSQSKLFDYHYVLSRIIYDNLDEDVRLLILNRCFIVESKKDVKCKILELLEINSYCLIFSMFGPVYFKLSHPLHIVGFANGWLTHSTLSTFNNVYPSIITRVKRIFKQLVTAFFIRQAGYWIVETKVAKNGLSKRAFINDNKIFVIPNSCGEHYFSMSKELSLVDNEFKKILVFCAPHPNKNLKILPSVANLLIEKCPDLKFKFILTLDNDYFQSSDLLKEINRKGLGRYFSNVGYVPVKDGPSLYDRSDCVFLPTLLETFTSVYPESIARNKDLITSDFPFSRDICDDAALYVDALDPLDCAEKIKKILFGEINLQVQRTRLLSKYKDNDVYRLYEDLFTKLVRP